MAAANLITPFPADIDREAFGHWLSGFIDGEACFMLRAGLFRGKDHFHAVFRIVLRDDDADVLQLIRSFWQCGRFFPHDNQRSGRPNCKPVAILGIAVVADLMATVIPHFDRYPLRAKKRNDFLIWRQGVELLDTVQRRPLKYRSGRAPNRHGGTFPKWTDAERERFRALTTELKSQRRYVDDQSPRVVE